MTPDEKNKRLDLEELQAISKAVARRLSANLQGKDILPGQREHSKPECQPIFSPEDSDLSALRWNLSSDGYAFGIKWIYAHRAVCIRAFGYRPRKGSGLVIDHINRNRLDNRRENLRITTLSGNRTNGERPQSPDHYIFTRFEGPRKIWVLRGRYEGPRRKYIGTYSSEEEVKAALFSYRNGEILKPQRKSGRPRKDALILTLEAQP